ncbi:MAG: hypothetical protein QXO40_04105 [Candidatus Aenigmatarchaeota archaeon]
MKIDTLLNNQILIIIYILSILGTGISIGYFLKAIKVEIKLLSLKIEILEERLKKIEKKLFGL